jgi:hypothetical protein
MADAAAPQRVIDKDQPATNPPSGGSDHTAGATWSTNP